MSGGFQVGPFQKLPAYQQVSASAKPIQRAVRVGFKSNPFKGVGGALRRIRR